MDSNQLRKLSVEFSPLFKSRRREASLGVRQSWEEAYELFLEDPGNSVLNLHELQYELKGTWSINVDTDYRALFKKYKNKIKFTNFGTHNQLYGTPKR